MPDRLLFSERLYETLLTLYPADFRSAYGEQMRLAFRDAGRDAYHRGGAGGLLALWLPTLLDLFKSALEERARRGEITMSKERLISWAGPLTIAVGLLWLVASIGEFVLLFNLASMDTFWDSFWLNPILLSFVLMIPAFIGTRLRYQEAAGRTGRIGLILGVAGCGGILVFVLVSILLNVLAPDVEQYIWPDYVIAACVLTIMIGHILFGIDALRNRLLPRWNLMPLLVALPVLLLLAPTLIIVTTFPRDNQSVPILITTFLRFAFTGIFWVLLGIVMAGERQGQEAAAAV